VEVEDEVDVIIGDNEVRTPLENEKRHRKQERRMSMDVYIPVNVKEIVNLEDTLLNDKRKKSNVVGHSKRIMGVTEDHSESSKGISEIITLGVDLEDGIVNTKQNAILNKLRKNNLVDKDYTFQLNFRQLYKLIEEKSKYQIRKLHHLHVYNLKMLIRYNPYAHVVEYVVFLSSFKFPTKYI